MNRERIRENSLSRTFEYIAPGELENRLAALQSRMREAALDLIVVDFNSENAGRWLSNAPAGAPAPNFIVVPQCGRAIGVLRPVLAQNGEPSDQNGCAVFTDDGEFVMWSFGHFGNFEKYRVATTGKGYLHPTCDLVDTVGTKMIRERAGAIQRIGVVDLDQISSGLYDLLGDAFPEAELTDASDVFYAVKAVKSEGDLEVIDEVVKQHEKLASAIASFITVGATEREIVVNIRDKAYRLGAGGSMWRDAVEVSLNSFPMEQGWTADPIEYPGRTVEFGDCILVRVQSVGLSGFYGAVGRCWSVGAPTEKTGQRWRMAVEAEDYCATLIRPGVTLAEIREKTNEWLLGRGFRPLVGDCVHSVGYCASESPSMRGKGDQLPLAQGMLLSVRVPVGTPDELPSPFACEDLYLVTAQGAERLTAVTRDIVEC